MTDQTDSGIGSSINKLFSAPVLTALRYLLTAISPLLAIIGVVALSPQKIDAIIATAQQIGVIVGAIAALIGVLAPIMAGIWGTFKSTQAQQVKSAAAIAVGPVSDVAASAQQAMIAGTNAIAHDSSIPASTEAKAALIDAVASQPEVVGKINVTDQVLVDATQSNQVQKAR